MPYNRYRLLLIRILQHFKSERGALSKFIVSRPKMQDEEGFAEGCDEV